MAFDFLLLFGQLNLLLLLKEKKKEVIKKTRLSVIETIKLFEYKKIHKSYWDKLKLYKQIVYKALLITKTLYLG